MEDCIFCKIAKGEIPKEYIYESDQIMVFEDIRPSAEIHLLIVPREHIKSFMDIKSTHLKIVEEMIKVGQEQVIKYNLEQGKFRFVFNGGEAQKVPHLHWHLLGGNLKGMPE